MDSLNTNAQSIVGGINEVNSHVGDISQLSTSEKTSLVGAVNEVKEEVSTISDPYEINLTNLLSAEDTESISTAIGGIDNLNATVQDNRIIVGTISNGNVSVSIRILGNVTTLYYLLDSVLGLTLNEIAITNTSGTLSKNVTTHSVLTENMVINSLNSDETTLPLSAAQGKTLNEKILNSNKVYIIDGSLLNEDNPTSEQISEAIGGWDNLANAVLNNNIILLQYVQSGVSQYCVAILALTGETDAGIQLWFMAAHELIQLVFTKQADTVSLGKSSSTLATSQDIIDAINELDSSGQTSSTGEVISSVSQENGVISVSKKTLTSDDIPELPQSKITDLDTALAAKADASALTAHTFNTSNPHSVTKEQVGLGNVDNTSDINKPISTATQTALDLKQDASDDSLNTTNKTIVGAINEILPKATGVGKIDPNSNGIGEIFNDYNNNEATGNSSHAEGQGTTASGNHSHAEGYNTRAIGVNAHAEGANTKATGNHSHAEGYLTIASGEYSHAEGRDTVASGDYAHAEGHYNFDDSDAIHMVGIGTSSSDRKNAHVIKLADGSHYIIGIGGYEGQSTDSAQSLQEVINGKQATLTAGTGIEITPENQINVTLDTTVFKVVSVLPDSPAQGDENKIHLVPAESTGANNSYTEYVWVNSAWEILGEYTSEVDLTPYLKSSDAESTYLKITDAESEYATKTELAGKQDAGNYVEDVTNSTGYAYVRAVGADRENGWVPLSANNGLSIVELGDGSTAYGTGYKFGINPSEVEDQSLTTTSKNLTGAINEVNAALYSPTKLDVSTLFADSATITSELSSQIAAYGESTATDFPLMYAGASIGNIKPTWIRTTSGVTNFMCIADNKIWYFEIQGTTVQRASLAIS